MAAENATTDSEETRMFDLVEKILRHRNSNGNITLNAELTKELKTLCRRNDALLPVLFENLLEHLQRDNVFVRLYALELTDEIFRRSHRFRECVVNNLQEFLKYTAETDPLHFPLPKPNSLAKQLKEKTLRAVHSWCITFGTAYRKLQTAYDYLKTCKTFDFQRVEAETLVERERAQRERERVNLVQERVTKKISEQFQEVRKDIDSCLTEINFGFNILIPSPSGEIASTMDRIVAGEQTVNAESLKVYGLPNTTFGLELNVVVDKYPINVNQDNADLIVSLKDSWKLISGRYLPQIRRLLAVLTKNGNDESLSKELIDTRVRLEEAKKKFDELEIFNHKRSADSDSDSDFEDVPEKEGFEAIWRETSPPVPDYLRTWSANDAASTSSAAAKHEPLAPKESETFDEPCTSASVSSKSIPENNGIPFVSYGPDLSNWEEKPFERTIVRSNADSHRFWRAPDDEGFFACPEDQQPGFRTRVFEFTGEFKPLERECRAPIGSGELCRRKDAEKCPFHGLIVERDDKGHPLDPNFVTPPSTSSKPNWQDEELMRDVAAATGKDLGGKKKRTKAAQPKQSTRERLEKKLLNRSSVKRVATTLDSIDEARNKRKFAAQWAYVYRDS